MWYIVYNTIEIKILHQRYVFSMPRRAHSDKKPVSVAKNIFYQIQNIWFSYSSIPIHQSSSLKHSSVGLSLSRQLSLVNLLTSFDTPLFLLRKAQKGPFMNLYSMEWAHIGYSPLLKNMINIRNDKQSTRNDILPWCIDREEQNENDYRQQPSGIDIRQWTYTYIYGFSTQTCPNWLAPCTLHAYWAHTRKATLCLSWKKKERNDSNK